MNGADSKCDYFFSTLTYNVRLDTQVKKNIVWDSIYKFVVMRRGNFKKKKCCY